jgi:hypothetical protein
MKKNLHITMLAVLFLTAKGAFGQTEDPVRIPFNGQGPTVRGGVHAKAVYCGVDTILYPYLKEETFGAPAPTYSIDAMVGSVRTASQAYHIQDQIQIHGVQFWGGAYSTSTAPQTLQVRAYLYSVDAANMPIAKLDSADVTVTNAYNFYEAIFPTPHTYGSNFAVAVRSIPNDTLAVMTNNADNLQSFPDYGESLAWRRFGSGTWNSTLSFFGQDVEYMIFPIVSYSISAGFTTNSPNFCTSQEVEFENTSSAILSNRMFNLTAFDDYWMANTADSSYTWSYDGTEESSVDGSYSFAAAGDHVVSLTAEMMGYYTSCSETYTDTIEVTATPMVTTSLVGNVELCEGGSLTVTAMPATGVDYQWIMDDEAVADSTEGSFTLTEAGDYSVIGSNVCGIDTSAMFTVSFISAPSAGVNASGPLQFCEAEALNSAQFPLRARATNG